MVDELRDIVVVLRHRLYDLRDISKVAMLEGAVAGVVGEGVEDVGIERGKGERADAAAGAADAAAQSARAIARVNERDELLHDVVLIAADGARVDVLAAAEAGYAVREDEDDAGHPASDEVIEVRVEAGVAETAVQVHDAAAGEAHEAEDYRIAPTGRLLVAGREVHGE